MEPRKTEKLRVVVRGFAYGELQFEDPLELDEESFGDLVPELAEKHGAALAEHRLHMIEIEFPDDPPSERFFRFGTDPTGMICPIEVVEASNLPRMYVVYDHPRDFPEVFVCRVWYGRAASADPFMTAATLDEIRDALEERGLVNIGRYAEDDPAIAEVWV
jgi:hypothetical protein